MILQITLATAKGARSILTQEINPDDASALKAEFEAAGMAVHIREGGARQSIPQMQALTMREIKSSLFP